MFPSPAGFLITLTPQTLCLMNQSQLVVLGRCDASNPSYQWAWSNTARLVHLQSSRCLWVDLSPRLPPHARLVKLSNCSRAPAWRCHGAEGAVGPAEAPPMYLKKLGSRLVVGENLQTSGWSRVELDSGGDQLVTSLCDEAGEWEEPEFSVKRL